MKPYRFLQLIFLLSVVLLFIDCITPFDTKSDQKIKSDSKQSQLFPITDIKEILGQWTFVYYQRYSYIKGRLPRSPIFDAMEFKEPGKVKLTSSINNNEISGVFSVKFGLMTYIFKAPDRKIPVTEKVGCFFANEGKAMVLMTDKFESVYFRSNRILKNDIAGAWSAKTDGEKEIMKLGQDGAYTISASSVKGKYWLWPSSRFGRIMTAIYREPPEGSFMALFLCENEKDNQLKLTPIISNELMTDKAVVWKKQ